MKKSNETQLTQLVKKYCEVETLPEVNTDIGETNLLQIKDGHDEFATLAQIINILRDEQLITDSEMNKGLARISKRKELLATFLNKNE